MTLKQKNSFLNLTFVNSSLNTTNSVRNEVCRLYLYIHFNDQALFLNFDLNWLKTAVKSILNIIGFIIDKKLN